MACLECGRKHEKELKEVFSKVFPLADEKDLPWATCHIDRFLRERVAKEVELGTRFFTSRVVKVLCEVSPPKAHVEDMARIVVDKAKEAERNAEAAAAAREREEDWRRKARAAQLRAMQFETAIRDAIEGIEHAEYGEGCEHNLPDVARKLKSAIGDVPDPTAD